MGNLIVTVSAVAFPSTLEVRVDLILWEKKKYSPGGDGT